jgi:hypothetical protein
MSTIRIRTWHVMAVMAVAVVAVGAVLASAACDAAARPVNVGVPLSVPMQEPIPAHASYQGWGSVRGDNGNIAFAPGSEPRREAWQWYPGYGWHKVSRAHHTRVYIYPYTGSWSWTWTQTTGWYAMRTQDLIIGYRPVAIAT